MAATGIISGKIISPSISFNETIDPNSNITVQLLDVSFTSALPIIIGQHTIPVGLQSNQRFPIEFHISFNTQRIKSNHQYAIAVNIVNSNRRLAWISTKREAVLTNRAPKDHITVVVEKV